MSVLIKGMEMPKSCFNCKMMVAKAVNEIEIMKYCCFLRKTALGVNRRKDCPLIEVPTPHGRLIDADALQLEAYNMMFSGYADDRDVAFVNFNLGKAPTTIESEVE